MRALWSTATLGVGEAASRGATLVLTLLIARTAGIGFLAELTLAQTLLAYATVSADAGLTAHAVRRLGNREDPADVGRETTSGQTALYLVALVVVYPLAAERTGWLLASCLVLYSLASTLMPSYLLQGRQEFRKLALVRAVTGLTTLSAGLIFLFAGSHVLVGLAYSLG